jgi:hypothetical protein
MCRIPLLVLSVLFLSACGGGSSSPSTPAVNTAPTLAGAFVINATANESINLVLTAADAQDDAVTVSIANSPEWLTSSLSANQFTITATPSLFDIGEQTISLSISDGNLSTRYDVVIQVADNPSSYVDVDLNRENIQGNWALSDGSQLHFTAEDGLLVKADGDLASIGWSFNDESFVVDVEQFGCNLACENIDSFEFRGVAQNESEFMLLIESDNAERKLLKLSPIVPSKPTSGAYSTLTLSSGSIFDTTQNNTKALFNLDYLFFVDFKFRGSGRVTLESFITNNPDGTFSLTEEDSLVASAGIVESFRNERFDFTFPIPFKIQINDAKIENMGGGLVQVSATFTSEIDTSQYADLPIDDYTGLREFLDAQITATALYAKMETVDFPSFEQGDSYLLTMNGVDEQSTQFSVISKLNVTGSDTAELSIENLSPNNPSTINASVTYAIEGNKLTLQGPSSSEDYYLYRNRFGRLITSGYQDSLARLGNYSSEFVKFEAATITEADLVGKWEVLTAQNISRSEPEVISFAVDERLDRTVFSDQRINHNDFYRIEDGKKISILRFGYCQQATSYDECRLRIEMANAEDPDGSISIETLEVASINGDEILFLQTFLFRNFDYRVKGSRTLLLKKTTRL